LSQATGRAEIRENMGRKVKYFSGMAINAAWGIPTEGKKANTEKNV